MPIDKIWWKHYHEHNTGNKSNAGNKSELDILKVLMYQVGRNYNQNKIWSDVINANIKQNATNERTK